MIGAILAFALEHQDLLELLYEGLTTGKLSKASALRALRAEMVAASDAEMHREIG